MGTFYVSEKKTRRSVNVPEMKLTRYGFGTRIVALSHGYAF